MLRVYIDHHVDFKLLQLMLHDLYIVLRSIYIVIIIIICWILIVIPSWFYDIVPRPVYYN